MSDAILTAIVGTIGAVFLAILGLYGSRKFKIGQAQDKLVSTLESIVQAQDRKIKELTDQLAEATQRIQTLEEEVAGLKGLTINQALEIQENKTQIESLQVPKTVTRRRTQ